MLIETLRDAPARYLASFAITNERIGNPAQYPWRLAFLRSLDVELSHAVTIFVAKTGPASQRCSRHSPSHSECWRVAAAETKRQPRSRRARPVRWRPPSDGASRPMLMTIPGATIYQIDETLRRVSLEETEHYQITREILAHPELYWEHLLEVP